MGGLESIIISFMVVGLSVLNHNNFDSYLVTLLYRPSNDTGNAGRFHLKDINGIIEYLNDTLHRKLLFCCKRNRKQEMICEARKALAKETDIVKIVK